MSGVLSALLDELHRAVNVDDARQSMARCDFVFVQHVSFFVPHRRQVFHAA